MNGDRAPRLGGHDVRVPREALAGLSGDRVALGVRPEDLHVVGSGEGIGATVELVEELGSDAFVHASVEQDGGVPVLLVARVNPKSPPEKGTKLWLAPAAIDQLHVFDPADGRRLSA